MIDNNTAKNNVVVTIEVWSAKEGKFWGEQKHIKRREFRKPFEYQDFDINFANPPGDVLEFRTYWWGKAWIKQNKVTVLELSAICDQLNKALRQK